MTFMLAIMPVNLTDCHPERSEGPWFLRAAPDLSGHRMPYAIFGVKRNVCG
jgi:hypothetical protein